MNDTATPGHRSPLPYMVGGGFVLLFVVAGFWQLDRLDEKKQLQAAFEANSGYSTFADGDIVRPFERLEVRGRYLEDRQIILDNMIVGGRVGHFVLTPLSLGDDQPLLIVNRGFVPLVEDGIHEQDIAVGDSRRVVRGRVGRLPRPGYRMGAAIPEVSSWPVHAVYPVYEDLEITLGRDVQPFVLLLDAGEADGFLRSWQPDGIGPGRHLAYAVQWFAMAAVLAGLLLWHARNRSFDND